MKGFDEKFIVKVVEGRKEITKWVKIEEFSLVQSLNFTHVFLCTFKLAFVVVDFGLSFPLKGFWG